MFWVRLLKSLSDDKRVVLSIEKDGIDVSPRKGT
jgi:hypothetical protein